jgi:hypothetical protein
MTTDSLTTTLTDSNVLPFPGAAEVPPLVPNMPYAEMKDHPRLSLDHTWPVFAGYLKSVSTRDAHIAEYGFVLLTQETGNALANLLRGKKCLDAGSGTGWLSHVLAEQGIDITASDKHTVNNGHGFKKMWRNDHDGDSVDLLPGAFDAVLLSWPAYDWDFGTKVLQAMSKGQLLVYQGEGYGGCTGDDEMHDMLNDDAIWEQDKMAERALNAHHLQFDGLHDRWFVYKKLL